MFSWFKQHTATEGFNFNQLFLQFPAALIVFEEGGRILLMNQWAARLLDLPESPKVYRHVDDFPYYLNALKAVLAPLDAQGKAQPLQCVVRSELSLTVPSQSSPRLLGYSIRSQQEAANDANGPWVMVFADISQFRAVESEAHQRVEEHFQAKKMMALSSLIGQLSQELHNPLLSGYVDSELLQVKLAKSSLPVEEQAPFLERLKRIQHSTVRAMDLVNNLVLYAKPLVLDLDKIDLDYFIQGLVVDWKRTGLIPPLVSVHYESPLQTYYTRVDTQHLRTAVEALIRNALEAAKSTELLSLHLSLEFVAPKTVGAPSFVRVNIRDNGAGILPEHLERLLEPFFSTKSSKSVGLGLCHVYKTIEQHGGHLSYTSVLGEGSTFHFTLPLVS